MSKSNNFFKIEMLLLKELEKHDCYGYEITQSIRDKSNGFINIQEGTLYPILYKLEDNLYISSKKEKIGKRKMRVYYHLEASGKVYLNKIYQDYKSMIKIVNNIMEESYE